MITRYRRMWRKSLETVTRRCLRLFDASKRLKPLETGFNSGERRCHEKNGEKVQRLTTLFNIRKFLYLRTSNFRYSEICKRKNWERLKTQMNGPAVIRQIASKQNNDSQHDSNNQYIDKSKSRRRRGNSNSNISYNLIFLKFE